MLIACAAVNAAAMAAYLYLTCRLSALDAVAGPGYALMMAVGYLGAASTVCVLGSIACAGFTLSVLRGNRLTALVSAVLDGCLGLMFLAAAAGLGYAAVGLVSAVALATAGIGAYAALTL